MSYCSRADLELRIGAEQVAFLADHDADGEEDEGVVDAALADISALIDATLASRWPQCVGQSSRLLSAIAVDLTLDRIAVGTARSADFDTFALRGAGRLDDIRDGLLRPCDAAPANLAGGASASAAAPVMSRDSVRRVL